MFPRPRQAILGLATAASALSAATPVAGQERTRVDGWLVSGNAMDGYVVELDRVVFRGGSASGRLASKWPLEAREFGVLSQFVRADAYRGKRVRFSAFVKTRDVAGEGASIWMRVDLERRVAAFDNMPRLAILGSTEWAQQTLVFDVPNDAVGIQYGLRLHGTGAAWLDDVTLEIVDNTTNVTTPALTSFVAAHALVRQVYSRMSTKPANLGLEPRP